MENLLHLRKIHFYICILQLAIAGFILFPSQGEVIAAKESLSAIEELVSDPHEFTSYVKTAFYNELKSKRQFQSHEKIAQSTFALNGDYTTYTSEIDILTKTVTFFSFRLKSGKYIEYLWNNYYSRLKIKPSRNINMLGRQSAILELDQRISSNSRGQSIFIPAALTLWEFKQLWEQLYIDKIQVIKRKNQSGLLPVGYDAKLSLRTMVPNEIDAELIRMGTEELNRPLDILETERVWNYKISWDLLDKDHKIVLLLQDEALYQPIDLRKNICSLMKKNYNPKLYCPGGTFADSFPELNRLTENIDDLPIFQIQKILSSEQQKSANNISIFGQSIQGANAALYAAIILAVMQLYFLAHLHNFRPEEKVTIPWIGLYRDLLSKALLSLTLVIGPLIVTSYAFFTSGNSTVENGVLRYAYLIGSVVTCLWLGSALIAFRKGIFSKLN